MVESVRIIPEGVHDKNGVFFAPDGHPHVPADLMCRIKQRPPVKVGFAVPFISEKDRPKNAIGIICGLSDFVCGLKMYVLYCVFLIDLILIAVKPRTGFDRGCASHDLRRNRS